MNALTRILVEQLFARWVGPTVTRWVEDRASRFLSSTFSRLTLRLFEPSPRGRSRRSRAFVFVLLAAGAYFAYRGIRLGRT